MVKVYLFEQPMEVSLADWDVKLIYKRIEEKLPNDQSVKVNELHKWHILISQCRQAIKKYLKNRPNQTE